MSKPPPRADEEDMWWTTQQRGVTVAEPQRKRLVDAHGREIRRAVGFVPPQGGGHDPKRG